jgi:hypothetical protein
MILTHTVESSRVQRLLQVAKKAANLTYMFETFSSARKEGNAQTELNNNCLAENNLVFYPQKIL